MSAPPALGLLHTRAMTSAGLILFRERDGTLEVLLGHMGGPFWARKDAGAWSIPKGELDEGEQPLAGARREFAEELGHAPPGGPVIELGEIRQRAGKRVIAFAVEGDFDPAQRAAGRLSAVRGGGARRQRRAAGSRDATQRLMRLARAERDFVRRAWRVHWALMRRLVAADTRLGDAAAGLDAADEAMVGDVDGPARSRRISGSSPPTRREPKFVV